MPVAPERKFDPISRGPARSRDRALSRRSALSPDLARSLLTPDGSDLTRRDVLRVMGLAVLGTGAALTLQGCAAGEAPATWVELDMDPATLPEDAPTEVPFTLETADGATVSATTWLAPQADGSLLAFDARCTHARCGYTWAERHDVFSCLCHEATFALGGAVLSGPPPRPLDRFPLRIVDGSVEIQVPTDLATPRPSG